MFVHPELGGYGSSRESDSCRAILNWNSVGTKDSSTANEDAEPHPGLRSWLWNCDTCSPFKSQELLNSTNVTEQNPESPGLSRASKMLNFILEHWSDCVEALLSLFLYFSLYFEPCLRSSLCFFPQSSEGIFPTRTCIGKNRLWGKSPWKTPRHVAFSGSPPWSGAEDLVGFGKLQIGPLLESWTPKIWSHQQTRYGGWLQDSVGFRSSAHLTEVGWYPKLFEPCTSKKLANPRHITLGFLDTC